jgi:hypothetical protein
MQGVYVHIQTRPNVSQMDAIKRAHQIFIGRSHSGEFPADDWISIGPNWDLNLYLDKNDIPRAVLYPVRPDGTTDTSTWTPIT